MAALVKPKHNVALHGRRLALARVVWAVCAGLTIVLFLAFIPLNLYGMRSSWLVQSGALAVARYVSLGVYANYVLVLYYFVAAVCLGIAGLIVWRKSDDGVALMVALGLILLPTIFVSVDGAGRIYPFYGPPWHALLQTARESLATVTAHYMVFLFFIFPDGRFVPRWVTGAAGGVLLLSGFWLGLSYGWASLELWFTNFVALLVLAVASQIYRYLRVSGPAERVQTKWFVAAVAFGPVWMLLGLFGISPGLSEPQANLVGLHLQFAWLLFLPLGVGIGVLRRGLWGADPIINRALVYTALTLLVLTLYGAIVFALGAAFGASGNVPLTVIATGVIAILFNPLRQRLQRAANRLMYGQRDDPATILTRLGQRLETALAPQATLTTIAETVAQTLKIPYVAIALMTENQPSRTVAHPPARAAPATLVSFPLTYQSELLGQLLVAPRSPGEAFSPADRRLLEQIAQQAAPAVRAYRLTADLHRSRERVIVGREEERRRLRRDLHDGLGPTLASQAFKLDAALELLDTNAIAARKLLDEVKAQTQVTVADIRRLVYELRPPSLDELGLVGALRAHVQSLPSANGLRVTLEAPPNLPPLSAAVEVAAYRIALEALTNVLRHAQASTCQVQLGVVKGRLHLAIADDGVGPSPETPAGMGLTSMRERADELGGRCIIENQSGGGTLVFAELPMTPTAYE